VSPPVHDAAHPVEAAVILERHLGAVRMELADEVTKTGLTGSTGSAGSAG